MAVALIAYRKLEPEDQKKIQAVLKNHPHFDDFLSAGRPVDAGPEEWVVMQAAVWPDWIKHPITIEDKSKRADITRNFSHGDWHFVNGPIMELEGASEDEQATIKANIEKAAGKGGELLNKLPQLLAKYKDQNDDDLAKLVWANPKVKPALGPGAGQAIALCWILHLVGDIHQPLHAATLFTRDAPAGDAGGNGYIVRLQNRAMDLHSIWDGAFGWDDLTGPRGSEFETVDVLTRDLLARIKPTADELAVTDIKKWADESFELARTKAYYVNKKLLPGKQVPGFHAHRPHAAELDPLPTGYIPSVKKVAEQRVTLAGYRLGALLKAIN
jgi:hypothetical protein